MSLDANNASSASQGLEELGYEQELKRALTLPQLCAYGINWVAPLGPAVIFGFLLLDGGSGPLPYIIGGIAMLFTASSYACLVPTFPLAGSAYNYVSKGMSPYIAFMLGWAMILDYVFFPTSTTMSTAAYVHATWPVVPSIVVLILIAAISFFINLVGVEIMAKFGFWLLGLGLTILGVSIGTCLWYVGVKHGGTGTIWSMIPFQFNSVNGLMVATSLAIFNFVGFDAVTTLSEESKDPQHDIPKAVYFTCLGAMIMFSLTGWAAHLVVPNWQELAAAGGTTWADTALFQINQIAGGKGFGLFYTCGYITNMLVFNVCSTTAAARLLFGMGRDNLLPKKIFGAVSKRFQTPHWNILIICLLILILSQLFTIQQVSLLINFGALLGFIFMNITAWYVFKYKQDKVKLFYCQPEEKGKYFLRYTVVPFIGFAICVYLFVSMTAMTHIVGTCWLVVGAIVLAIKTKGFKTLPPEIHES